MMRQPWGTMILMPVSKGLRKCYPTAKFPFLCTNYDFSDTILNGKTETHKIFTKGNLKIGVFGVGVELDGLVSPELYKETQLP